MGDVFSLFSASLTNHSLKTQVPEYQEWREAAVESKMRSNLYYFGTKPWEEVYIDNLDRYHFSFGLTWWNDNNDKLCEIPSLMTEWLCIPFPCMSVLYLPQGRGPLSHHGGLPKGNRRRKAIVWNISKMKNSRWRQEVVREQRKLNTRGAHIDAVNSKGQSGRRMVNRQGIQDDAVSGAQRRQMMSIDKSYANLFRADNTSGFPLPPCGWGWPFPPCGQFFQGGKCFFCVYLGLGMHLHLDCVFVPLSLWAGEGVLGVTDPRLMWIGTMQSLIDNIYFTIPTQIVLSLFLILLTTGNWKVWKSTVWKIQMCSQI